MTVMDDRAFQERIDAQNDLASLCSPETEQALLGAVLLNNNAYRRVREIVKIEHFTDELHRRIWDVASTLLDQGSVADPITLTTRLGRDEVAPGVTIPLYLARLVGDAVTVSGAPDYAREMQRLWVQRELFHRGQELMRLALNPPINATPSTLFDSVEQSFASMRPKVGNDGERADFVPLDVYLQEALRGAEETFKSRGKLIGFSTGLGKLDAALAGIRAPDLVIVGARPGMGKTALAMNVASAAAKECRMLGDGSVGIASLEMSGKQLAERVLSDPAEVPFFLVRRGAQNDEQMQRLVDMERQMRGLPIFVDQDSGTSIDTLAVRARTLKRTKNLKLLIVDYLQLLSGSKGGPKDKNRAQEVAEITKGLKGIAKELDIPVIALSQLSRNLEDRPDKRPKMQDLRESGSIEQDADTIMFLYREEYYLKNEEPPKNTERHVQWQRDMHRAEGVAEILIPKNRHGPPFARVRLGWEGQFTRFVNDPPDNAELPPELKDPKPKKEAKAKEAPLSDLADTIWRTLEDMTIHDATPATEAMCEVDRDLTVGTRVVGVSDLKKEIARKVHAKAELDNKEGSAFSKAFQELHRRGAAAYTGSAETGFYAWMREPPPAQPKPKKE